MRKRSVEAPIRGYWRRLTAKRTRTSRFDDTVAIRRMLSTGNETILYQGAHESRSGLRLTLQCPAEPEAGHLVIFSSLKPFPVDGVKEMDKRGGTTMNRLFTATLSVSLSLVAAFHPASAADSRYEAVLGNPDRYEADLTRDAGRKPAQVLTLLGVEPGMEVLDLYSGGGYYSELLSSLVGSTGKVVAHNNTPYLNFVGDELAARYTPGRLENVERIVSENNELALEANRFDAIMMMLTYHDFYYVDPDNGWPALDGPKLLAELHQSLKPGGAIIISDHYAAPGSPPETGGTTHRIDPAIVIDQMEAAGFELTDRGDFLRNKNDDYTKSVFDESIRGKSDRFVLRFEKR